MTAPPTVMLGIEPVEYGADAGLAYEGVPNTLGVWLAAAGARRQQQAALFRP